MAARKGKRTTKPATEPTLNEADFQAAIIARLREALPLLPAEIRAERYLNLKLGHHHITVDGTGNNRDAFKGRSDVVVFLDRKPLLLAELKAPDVPITEEDVDQGLSYARIHQPMVPLVLATNGDPAATRLVLTYDGTEVSSDKVDAAGLKEILSAASKLASSSAEGAIRNLLGHNPAVWTAIVKDWNAEEISSRTGSIGDHHRALAEHFQIPREAVDQVCKEVESAAKVVVLHGPPLSGVTCSMIQLIERLRGKPALYIDRRSSGDILQFLASRLTRELSIGVSRDDVRQWLITGQSLAGLILLVDGIPSGELEELLHLSELNRLQLVLGTDTDTFDSLRTLSGRVEETMLGRLAKPVELKELSRDEFRAACKLFFEIKGAHFLNGAELIPDLRRPRHLRLVASLIPQLRSERKITASGEEFETRIIVPPILNFKMLECATKLIGADPKMKHDLSKLATAYLKDVTENGRDMERIVETYGVPSIDPDLLELALGEPRIERLRRNGMIHWIDTRRIGPRLVIRFPEQLAHYISVQWAAELNGQPDQDGINTALESILQQSHFTPYGDLCAAAAIAQVKDGRHLAQIIHALLAFEPQATVLAEGAVVEVLAKDLKGTRIRFGKGMSDRLPGDVQPWLVLSHLATAPMEREAGEISANLSIFAELGNHEDLIFMPAPGNLEDMPGLHTHDVPGVGSLLCASSGIVEPIMQAMYMHASHRPDEFEQLVTYALHENKRFLAWRLKTLCGMLQNDRDSRVSTAALRAGALLDDYWNALIASSENKSGNNSAEADIACAHDD